LRRPKDKCKNLTFASAQKAYVFAKKLIFNSTTIHHRENKMLPASNSFQPYTLDSLYLHFITVLPMGPILLFINLFVLFIIVSKITFLNHRAEFDGNMYFAVLPDGPALGGGKRNPLAAAAAAIPCWAAKSRSGMVTTRVSFSLTTFPAFCSRGTAWLSGIPFTK
jgi:hypothetical protein